MKLNIFEISNEIEFIADYRTFEQVLVSFSSRLLETSNTRGSLRCWPRSRLAITSERGLVDA